MIKVCHLTSAHDSSDVRIFHKECAFLAREEDLDVYLVAPGESRSEKNVTVIGVGEKPGSRIKRMFTFTKKVYEAAVNVDADVYHFHDPELLGTGLKLKRLGKKVVFDSHEYTVEQIKIKTYIPKLARNIIAKVFHMYESSVCRKIDAVIFPCGINGKHPFEGRAQRTLYIDNFPILEEFSVTAKEDRKYDVCHIGSLDAPRGIPQLLEAVKIAGCNLALGGNFPTEEYHKDLAERGLLENVDYRGFCNRQTVVEIYSDSKVGASTILPLGQYTMGDNMPTKVYEFMAMGIPVIISNFRYPTQLLKEYEFGIAIDPEDPESIAAGISTLLGDDELRERMGREGRRAVEEVFNWESEIRKIVSLYKEIN